ncbi:hypothetical protein FOL46_000103 [Perkinsus olseni]|uniref:Uncharacterized protein n=1 Tax=Perkinsus olseni TaxID=32597 RepID=A0A7J6MWF9_PEROL|nr:hypothetical protein FOL46_000103 [Perkinsus olseni]
MLDDMLDGLSGRPDTVLVESCPARPSTAPELSSSSFTPPGHSVVVPYPPREIYSRMSKFVILVVDFSEAVLLSEGTPITFQALKSGIAEALGTDAEVKLVEMIMSSYTGLSRNPIQNDADLCDFYGAVQAETSSNEKAPSKTDILADISGWLKRDLEDPLVILGVQQLREHYEEVIASHVRKIEELQKGNSKLREKLKEREEDLSSLTGQLANKLSASEKDIAKRVKGELDEKLKAYEAKVAEKEKQLKAQLKQKGQQIVAQQREISDVRRELEKTREDLHSSEALVKEHLQTVSEQNARIDELIAECERLMKEGVVHAALCPTTLDETMGENPSRRQSLRVSRSSSRRASVESAATRRSSVASVKPIEERSRFTFTVPHISDKIESKIEIRSSFATIVSVDATSTGNDALSCGIRYQKGRPYLSEEVNDITGLEFAQVELFPCGDITSRDGWCAIKLRVPNRTKIRWSVTIGRQQKGPRVDVFEESLWWCRYGLLWANFCPIASLSEGGDDDDSDHDLTVTVEIHSARVIEEGDISDAESTASSGSAPGRCLACGKELASLHTTAVARAQSVTMPEEDAYPVQSKRILTRAIVGSIFRELSTPHLTYVHVPLRESAFED